MSAAQAQIDQCKRARNEKLLVLHHELLYPAFLGAVLFEFARKAYPGFLLVDFPLITSNIAWFTLNFRWFATALWFMLYFTVAFLALHDTKECARFRDHFGWIPFLANFVEIAAILLVLVALSLPHSAELGKTEPLKLNYPYIFVVWMLIPVTAAISNYVSRRIVHGAISLAAFVLGLTGYCLNGRVDWEHGYGYWVLLTVIYLPLAAYYWYVFWPAATRPWLWLGFQMQDNCRWPEWAPRGPARPPVAKI
jgi:hypothetical protein